MTCTKYSVKRHLLGWAALCVGVWEWGFGVLVEHAVRDLLLKLDLVSDERLQLGQVVGVTGEGVL